MKPKKLFTFHKGPKLPPRESRVERAYRLKKQEESRQNFALLQPAINENGNQDAQTSSATNDVWEEAEIVEDGGNNSYWTNVAETIDDDEAETTANIRSHNQMWLQRQRNKRWSSLLHQLLPAYLLLKKLTRNWTAQNSFDDLTELCLSCHCQPQDLALRPIDAVDLMGQHRRSIVFCKCTPDPIRLLAQGYLASTPIAPQTAFSIRLLNFHHILWNLSSTPTSAFAEVLRRWNETRSPRLLTQRSQKSRDLRKPLSASIDIYRDLLTKSRTILDTAISPSRQESLARNSCPACFGPISNHDLASAQHRIDNAQVILCLDGNFQHRHHEKASKNHLPLSIPPLFLDPKEIDAAEEDIRTKEMDISKTQKQRDKCSEQHKAADDKRNSSTWKGCDDTGLLSCCCRHDAVVYLCNIFKTGERRSLSIAMLKRIMSELDERTMVGILYDIGCSLDKFINIRGLLPEYRDRLRFGTSVFHAYVHDWPCQLDYNPRYNKSWGLSDGEGLEWLWSYLSPLVSPLRYATRNHRFGAIGARCQFHNDRGIEKLMIALNRKLSEAVARRNAAIKIMHELGQLRNPHLPSQGCYTEAFFRAQWADQRNFEKQQTQQDQEHKANLAEIYEREERLKVLQENLVPVRLDDGGATAMSILEQIAELQNEQLQTATRVGGAYGGWLDSENREQQRLLLLMWSAKSNLFKLAVEQHAERQPLLHSKKRGDHLGTRMKEKIFEALNRRKPAAVKALAVFAKRQQTYLEKFAPHLLNKPDYQPIVYKDFLEMGLNHDFWNDGYFCLSKAPWALDREVRAGIQASLQLDRSREELIQLTAEIRRTISWAVSLHKQLSELLEDCLQESMEPSALENYLVDLNWPTYDSHRKRTIIAGEVQEQLSNHEKLMEHWSDTVAALWARTCQRNEADHEWFARMDVIYEKRRVTDDDRVQDLLAQLNPTLEELVLNDQDADGEDTENVLGEENDSESGHRLIDDLEE